jgi:hypothetical protein
MKKMAKKFPDLTGDGKVTQKDVLKGRGVKLKAGGQAKRKFGDGGGTLSSDKLRRIASDAGTDRQLKIIREENKKRANLSRKYKDRGESGKEQEVKETKGVIKKSKNKQLKEEAAIMKDFKLIKAYGRDAPKDRGFNTRRYANGGAAITKTNQKPHMS